MRHEAVHRLSLLLCALGVAISAGLIVSSYIVGAQTVAGEQLSRLGVPLTQGFVILTLVLAAPMTRRRRATQRK